jgi:hypothetical protein
MKAFSDVVHTQFESGLSIADMNYLGSKTCDPGQPRNFNGPDKGNWERDGKTNGLWSCVIKPN